MTLDASVKQPAGRRPTLWSTSTCSSGATATPPRWAAWSWWASAAPDPHARAAPVAYNISYRRAEQVLAYFVRYRQELKQDVVPKTAENFRKLCDSDEATFGYRKSRFHRIIPGFVRPAPGLVSLMQIKIKDCLCCIAILISLCHFARLVHMRSNSAQVCYCCCCCSCPSTPLDTVQSHAPACFEPVCMRRFHACCRPRLTCSRPCRCARRATRAARAPLADLFRQAGVHNAWSFMQEQDTRALACCMLACLLMVDLPCSDERAA